MKAMEFSQALGEIDSRYLEEAISYTPGVGGRRRLPMGLLAAILAALLLGCGAAAAAVWGGPFPAGLR